MAAISQIAAARVDITPLLWTRPIHSPDSAAEAAIMRRISDAAATDPSQLFQVCAEGALELCHADTCGISLGERTHTGDQIFRWIALAGVLKQHLYGTTPRYSSPCGVCVDNGMPMLMRQPELVYKYLDVGPPFYDVLLIPLIAKGSQLEATIWIVAHTRTRKFDGEDARVVQRIAGLIATALTWRQSRRK
jgi:GAF domain-containing protein